MAVDSTLLLKAKARRRRAEAESAAAAPAAAPPAAPSLVDQIMGSLGTAGNIIKQGGLGINRGIVNTVGLPGDLGRLIPQGVSPITDALRVAPTGQDIQHFFKLDQSQPQSFGDHLSSRIGEEVGANLIPGLGITRKAVELGLPAVRAAGGLTRYFLEPAAVDPAKYLAKEVAASTAAGTGAGLADSIPGVDRSTPMGQIADTAGALGGLGAYGLSGALVKGLGSIFRAVTGNANYVDDAVKNAVVDRLGKAGGLDQNANAPMDTQTLVDAINTPPATRPATVVPGFQESLADRTGNPGIAALEYGRQSGPSAGEFAVRRSANNEAVDAAMRGYEPAETPGTFRSALADARDTQVNGAAANTEAARSEFDRYIQNLSPQMAGEDRGAAVRSGVANAERAAREGESNAWSGIQGQVDPAPLADTMDATRGALPLARQDAVSNIGNTVDIPRRLAGTQEPTVKGFSDTRGKEQFFHGSPKDMALDTEGHYSSQNIYGQGLYSSDAMDVVDGYAKRGGSTTPKHYKIVEGPNVKIFNMEQPIPDWLVQPDDDLAHAAIDTEAPKSVRELYDAMRSVSRGDGYSADDVQGYFDTFRSRFEDNGFNTLQHKGGVKTGSPEHTVRIYLNKDAATVEPVDPAGYKPAKKTVDIQELNAMRSELTRVQRDAASAGDTNRAEAAGRFLTEVNDYLASDAVDPAVRAQTDSARAASRDVNERFNRPNDPLAKTLAAREGRPNVPDSAVARQFVQPDAGQASNIDRLLAETDLSSHGATTRAAVKDEILAQMDKAKVLGDPQAIDSFLGSYSRVFDRFPDLRDELTRTAAASRALSDASTTQADLTKAIDTGPVGKYLQHGDATSERAMSEVLASKDPAAAADELMNFIGDNPRGAEGARAAFWQKLKAESTSADNSQRSMGGKYAWRGDWLKKFLESPRTRAVAERLYRDQPEQLANVQKIADVLDNVDLRQRGRAPGTSGTAQGVNPVLTVETMQSRAYAYFRGQVSGTYLVTSILAVVARRAVRNAQGAAIERLTDKALLNPEFAAQLLKDDNPANRAALNRKAKLWLGNEAGNLLQLFDQKDEQPQPKRDPAGPDDRGPPNPINSTIEAIMR